MLAFWMVKTAGVCQSVGSSALREYLPGRFKVPICCVDFYSPVAEATEVHRWRQCEGKWS